MRCLDPEACPCMSHKSPETHLPACPHHLVPLTASRNEPGRGFCLLCYEAGRHAHHRPEEWRWVEKDNYSGWDVPPWNGCKVLDPPAELL